MKKSRLLVTGSALSFTLFGALPSFAQEVEQPESAEVSTQSETEVGAEETAAEPI